MTTGQIAANAATEVSSSTVGYTTIATIAADSGISMTAGVFAYLKVVLAATSDVIISCSFDVPITNGTGVSKYAYADCYILADTSATKYALRKIFQPIASLDQLTTNVHLRWIFKDLGSGNHVFGCVTDGLTGKLSADPSSAITLAEVIKR